MGSISEKGRIAMNLDEENDKINALCDWIEETRSMMALFPVLVDAYDLDMEGCFV